LGKKGPACWRRRQRQSDRVRAYCSGAFGARPSGEGAQPERNRLLEAVAEAALALRRGERDAGRRLGAALGRLDEAPNPGRGWLAPEAVTLVREALQGALDGLARKPPVVGTLAAGRVADALAVLPKEA
jgi:hypothetical protein